jgi:hypothetical protein
MVAGEVFTGNLKIFDEFFVSLLNVPYICTPIVLLQAEVAHLVEHDLAKVGVAGSSPVFRSQSRSMRDFFSLDRCPGGGIGRHAGLKIL